LALEQLTGGSVTALPSVVKELPPATAAAPIVEPPQPRPPRTTTTRDHRARSAKGDQPTLPLT
jgi:hypothetical protein